MDNLILPTRVTIQLVNKNKLPLRIPYVLFRVTAFAAIKDNFVLQPFASDSEGLVTITKKELEARVADCHDSGLMNYAHINGCSASVEIRLLTDDDIRRAVEARRVWNNLLARERDRWASLEQLLDLYRNSNNGSLLIDRSPPWCVKWSEKEAEYSYKCTVVPRDRVS